MTRRISAPRKRTRRTDCPQRPHARTYRRLNVEPLEDRRLLATGVFANVPEAAGYSLIYELPIPNNANFSTTVPYTVNNSAGWTQTFDRIAYYLELTSATYGSQWVYASMDAFTTDVTKIGVPKGQLFQRAVASMNVFSNAAGVATGTGISTGNIEFWSSNYGAAKSSANSPPNQVPSPTNASDSVFDFGDSGGGTGTGHGSMQIHNYDVDGTGSGTAGQTLFGFNRWNSGGGSDLGIGNQLAGTGNPDWTHAANSAIYTLKNLAVLVRPTALPASTPQNVSGTSGPDNLLLQVNGGNAQYTLDGGTNWFNLTGGHFVFDGQGDDDTVTIDTTNGNPIPVTGAQFIGNTDTGVPPGDNIVLQGPATTVLYSFVSNNDGSINIDGRTLSYTGLEPITDNLNAANRSFSFTGGAETITLADTGGADGLTTIDSDLGESVTFANPTNSLTIITNGGDTVNLNSDWSSRVLFMADARKKPGL